MDTHPKFCEVIRRGSRSGTFLGSRGPAQYAILWDDEDFPKWVPAMGIDKTGRINHSVIMEFSSDIAELEKNISSKTKIRRRGGLKRGVTSVVGKTKGQGRAGSPNDPRLAHKPVEDEGESVEGVA